MSQERKQVALRCPEALRQALDSYRRTHALAWGEIIERALRELLEEKQTRPDTQTIYSSPARTKRLCVFINTALREQIADEYEGENVLMDVYYSALLNLAQSLELELEGTRRSTCLMPLPTDWLEVMGDAARAANMSSISPLVERAILEWLAWRQEEKTPYLTYPARPTPQTNTLSKKTTMYVPSHLHRRMQAWAETDNQPLRVLYRHALGHFVDVLERDAIDTFPSSTSMYHATP